MQSDIAVGAGIKGTDGEALHFFKHFVPNLFQRSLRDGYGVAFVLIAALSVAYFVNSSAFEGLLPDIMTKLSLFRQFNSFVNGAFDLTAIVYYVSVMGFFLFLSVQSMEKRRYN